MSDGAMVAQWFKQYCTRPGEANVRLVLCSLGFTALQQWLAAAMERRYDCYDAGSGGWDRRSWWFDCSVVWPLGPEDWPWRAPGRVGARVLLHPVATAVETSLAAGGLIHGKLQHA